MLAQGQCAFAPFERDSPLPKTTEVAQKGLDQQIRPKMTGLSYLMPIITLMICNSVTHATSLTQPASKNASTRGLSARQLGILK